MAKIDWNVDYNETEAVDINGVTVQVKKQIPYEKKLELIKEYAEAAVILNDDGVGLMNPYRAASMVYLILKYYTDIEFSDGDNLGWIYDYNIKYNILDKIGKVCKDDMNVSFETAEDTAKSIAKEWRMSHSIQSILAKLSSDSEIEKLAHAAPLNEELIALMQERNEAPQNENVMSLAEFAKKDWKK